MSLHSLTSEKEPFRNVDNMIVVAASDNDESYSKAWYSKYGTAYVDVSAPGQMF